MDKITVTILFNKELESITKKSNNTVTVKAGTTFVYLLFNIFAAYPEMDAKYPPGRLGFLLNGTPPKTHTRLLDGDIVFMTTK